jgi:hypothetical protein
MAEQARRTVFDDAAGHPVSIDAHGSRHVALPRGSAAWVQLKRTV